MVCATCADEHVRDQFAAVDRLERAIDAIQNKIEAQGGALTIKMKVRSCFIQPRTADVLSHVLAFVAQGGVRDGGPGPRTAHGEGGVGEPGGVG